MVAYSFEKRHHDNILSGDKPFTVRKLGKKRHARIGEAVQFRDGRTGPVFATGQCVFRATIVFGADGLRRVTNPSFTPEGERLFRLFSAAEDAASQAAQHREKVAVQDGFTSWDDMVAWHAEQEGLKDGPAPGETITREVIGFACVEVKA